MTARSTAARIFAGHPRAFAGLAMALGTAAITAWAAPGWPAVTRAILSWDVGAATFLALSARVSLLREPDDMDDDAEAQEQGQWTIFTVMILGTIASFAALGTQFDGLKEAPELVRSLRVALVAGTLVLSWLFAHVAFGFRYAHEWYDRNDDGTLKRGLDFPGGESPDYWDFLYFSIVIGMTFQVSDVQITRRSLRRLATLHGLVSFAYNTVIVALTVNIAAGLIS